MKTFIAGAKTVLIFGVFQVLGRILRKDFSEEQKPHPAPSP